MDRLSVELRDMIGNGGHTVTGVASALGATRRTIYNWISGRSSISRAYRDSVQELVLQKTPPVSGEISHIDMALLMLFTDIVLARMTHTERKWLLERKRDAATTEAPLNSNK